MACMKPVRVVEIPAHSAVLTTYAGEPAAPSTDANGYAKQIELS